MRVFGLLLAGAFVTLFAVDFLPIVRDSPITGSPQTLFGTFPTLIYVLGFFSLVGAAIIVFTGQMRR